MPDPRRDEIALAALLARLKTEGGISLKEIQDFWGVDERTAYRWLDYVGEKIIIVRGEHPPRYRVIA